MKPIAAIRILFLGLCVMAGYAVSQVRPEFTGVAHSGTIGMASKAAVIIARRRPTFSDHAPKKRPPTIAPRFNTTVSVPTVRVST